MENKINALKSGFHTAFVDQMENSNIEYRPEFVSNNYKQGKKVLVSIEQELAKCNEFQISKNPFTLSKRGCQDYLTTA